MERSPKAGSFPVGNGGSPPSDPRRPHAKTRDQGLSPVFFSAIPERHAGGVVHPTALTRLGCGEEPV